MGAERSVAALARVPRTGWVLKGVARPESVADHVFGTLAVVALANDLEPPPGAARPDDALLMTLVHDLAETETGDLTYRTRKYILRHERCDSYAAFEAPHLLRILEAFPPAAHRALAAAGAALAEPDDPAAVRVHAADVVDMLAQAYEYELAGHRDLGEFWDRVARCRRDPTLYGLARAIQDRRNLAPGRAAAAARVHGFLRAANRAKLLRVDLRDPAAETIAQQTFRIALLAAAAAIELGLDAPRAIRGALAQGFVETQLGEIPPGLRARFGPAVRRAALADMLKPLPERLAGRWLAFYDDAANGREGGLVDRLRARDYRLRLGAAEAGVPDLDETDREAAAVMARLVGDGAP